MLSKFKFIFSFSFVIVLFVFVGYFSRILAITANECLTKNLDDLSQGEKDWCYSVGIPQLQSSIQGANETNRRDLNSLRSQLNSLSQRINAFLDQLQKTQIEINQREESLAYTKEIFNQKARDQYTFLRLYDPVVPFIFSDSASKAFREISFRQRIADADRKTMDQYAQDLLKLKEDKNSLQKSKDSLTAAQKIVSDKANFLAGEVAKADAYIATLSAKQQSFLAAKLAGLGLPLTLGAGALSCTDDRKLDPTFGSGFAFFTFGIPHYVGMNQYGAYGRATFGGQNYKTILQDYYANTTIECRNMPENISVQEFGVLPFEEYIKGVVNKEMGADIPEALKAQAVAARSFALNQPQPICTSQFCQVYSSSRRGAANDAVDATGVNVCGAGRAEVLVSNGQIITAWYASTFGGYAHRSSVQLPNAGNTSYTKEFVDAQGPVNSLSDLFGKAYDRESKCFYAAQGWRSQYGNSAWLRPSEVADIANAILLARRDSSAQPHLCQVDKPPNPNYGCSDTWSADTVRSKLGPDAYETVDIVSMGFDFGSGRTTSVTVSGSGHTNPFSGSEFKDYFNLRAPSNIQIVGPLYNVEIR